ncbi:hypothetical protein [Hydrogenophaga crassostreae]|uniref:hypothetical protein n=1 Tax=Hydrogenophaga crassostreae TaxID=1763535 RepID=UPI000A4A70E5|nr:hypothetical protein [Hydrogenophaga crassostreae]
MIEEKGFGFEAALPSSLFPLPFDTASAWHSRKMAVKQGAKSNCSLTQVAASTDHKRLNPQDLQVGECSVARTV